MSASSTPTKIDIKLQEPIEWLDRDLSLLSFNERVLDWAKRPEVPLLERLRYLCIVSSNLDEFFEVRGALHNSVIHEKQKILSEKAHELVQSQYALYNLSLIHI